MSDIDEKLNQPAPGKLLRGLQNGSARITRRIQSFLAGKSSPPETAQQNREITLPRDLYAHPETETEWWYYTGHCKTITGRSFCFELVFFKRQTDRDHLGILPLRLLANPMYAAHFAITDIDREKFHFKDRKCFIPFFDQIASASETELDLSIGDWEIKEFENIHLLRANLGRELIFEASLENTKSVALNGHQKAGPDVQQTDESSSHFSYTRMKIEGELTENGKRDAFYGEGWMDREFGTWYQRNWDWFSIQFADQTELMLYHFRNGKNETIRVSHGTFIERDGTCIYLKQEDFQIKPIKHWKSPQTETIYPAEWEIKVAGLDLEIKITPHLENQELDTRRTTMIVYWEGACRVSGTKKGRPTQGSAYVELVGYDGLDEKPTLIKFLGGFVRNW